NRMNPTTSRDRDDPRTTVLLILVPMLAMVLGLRLYLHGIDVETDLRVAGHEVHHLFTGSLIETAAAFALAFGPRRRPLRRAALAALGAGSGMVLDEVVYLVTTDGSNAAYLTPLSLGGACVLLTASVVWLLVLAARTRRDK